MVSRSNPIIKTKPNRTEQKRWRVMYCWCDGGGFLLVLAVGEKKEKEEKKKRKRKETEGEGASLNEWPESSDEYL